MNVVLLTQSNEPPNVHSMITGMDVTASETAFAKVGALLSTDSILISQLEQLSNPDARIVLELLERKPLLEEYASCVQGLRPADRGLLVRSFWEIEHFSERWRPLQSTAESTQHFSGMDGTFDLGTFDKKWRELGSAYKGHKQWGKLGVCMSQMSSLPSTIYIGAIFDGNVNVFDVHRPENLPAVWSYCSSDLFKDAVRKIDSKMVVTNATLGKVPFDLPYWQQAASARYPNGLPKPYSDDPTQWIFHGHPQPSTDPLQVAVARLLGYTWPAESDDKMELAAEAQNWVARCQSIDAHIDDDGIVCLSPVRGEKAADERLLALLIDSWETVEPGSWKASMLDRLLADVDCAGKGLDVWLREKFFEQHSKLFHHRPFIWHVWDGLKDGFGALVNYHLLDAKNLERLIHTYLGDWIRNQEAGVASGVDGAELRLAAAKQLKTRLETILEGNAPHDIFVRWKPLDQQSIGWNPDLNDGVRMNIRPFMTAEVLRHNKKPKLNITWDKDRGKDVVSAPWFHKFDGERINAHHLTLAEKKAAREKMNG